MTIEEAAAWLHGRDKFLILTHVRPDGDTLGCAAALCRSLREGGKEAYILQNPQTTELFAEYVRDLTVGEDYQPQTVVSVDIAALSLFPDNAKTYHHRVDLAIDHHPSQEFFAQHTCVDPKRAACAELLFEILRRFGPITPDTAAALYVGLSTDCGCFAFGNTSADSHRIAAELIDLGAPVARLNKKHFQTRSMKRLRLESALVSEMELHEQGQVALLTLSLELMDRLQAAEDDAEGIASLGSSIEGVRCSITLREQSPTSCKISLRTDPAWVNATQVCALLGGGGHAAAGGCTVASDIPGAKRAILEAVHKVREAQACRTGS